MFRLIFASIILANIGQAQLTLTGQRIDLSHAGATRPMKMVTVLPTGLSPQLGCLPGDMVQLTIAPAGQQIYVNSTTGGCTWTVQGGSGGGGGLADPGANGVIKRTAFNVTAPALFGDITTLFAGCTGTLLLGADGACHAAGGLSDPGANGLIRRTAFNTTSPAIFGDVVALFSGCSGIQYLGADGTCHTPSGGGLADPGANGVVKRTSLNTTAPALFGDIVSLFSGCSGTQYLGADGACHSASSGGSYITASTTSPQTILAVTHGQGINADAFCFSGTVTSGTTTGHQVLCDYSKNAFGDVTVTWGGTSVASIQVFSSGAGPAGPPGPGGSPGGTPGQIQTNVSGSTFGGFTASGDATINTTTGVVSVSRTLGTPFAPSATIDMTNVSNAASGTLIVARGGTGVGSLTGIAKGTGTAPFTSAASVDVVGLFTGCSGIQYLGADGACHNAWTGTPAGVTGDLQINSAGSFGAVHPASGTAGFPRWNGSAWAVGNVPVGSSGGLDCSTVPGQCDIVTTVVPRFGFSWVQTGLVNFIGSSSTAPNRSGTGSPNARDNCANVGETYFQSDAVAGSNTWGCTGTGTPGTWTLQGNGGGGGGAYVVNASTSPQAITAVTHGKGINALVFCYDAAVSSGATTGNLVGCAVSKNSAGDLTVYWSGTSIASIEVIAPGGGSGGGGGSVTPYVVNASTSPQTITAVTHGQGINPWIFCLDGAISGGAATGNNVGCSTFRNSSGDVTVTWTGTTVGSIEVMAAGGGGGGGGSFGPVLTSLPITGGPIVATGTISCPTCATVSGSPATNALLVYAGSNGVKMANSQTIADAFGDIATPGWSFALKGFFCGQTTDPGNAGGSNAFGLICPTAIGSSYRWALPAADAAGVITSDGNANPGHLSISPTSGSGNILRASAAAPPTSGSVPLKGNGAGGFSSALAADMVGLFTSCSGSQYLGADGACHAPAGGLADPGSNGIVKRTALNVTAPAVSGTDFAPATSGSVPLKGSGAGGFSAAIATDIVSLFGGCTGVNYLGADGACHAPTGSPGGSTGTIQWNNAGTFAGFTASGDATINTTTGVVSVSRTLGTPFAPSATIDMTNVSNAVSGNLAVARGGTGVGTLSGVLKGNGTSPISSAAAADVVALFSGCSGTQYLGADGACHSNGSTPTGAAGGGLHGNYPNPYTENDIRGYGATCNGTDQHTAVLAALNAGRQTIYIPDNCTWQLPTVDWTYASGAKLVAANSIPPGLHIIGENWRTSTVRTPVSGSPPVPHSPLWFGPSVILENINVLSDSCNSQNPGIGLPYATPPVCPITYLQNQIPIYTGTVNTSGTSVTLQTGDLFVTNATGANWLYWGPSYSQAQLFFVINGVSYSVSSVASNTSLTLTTSAGTQTGATFYAYQYMANLALNNTTLSINTMGPQDSNGIHIEGNGGDAIFVALHSSLGVGLNMINTDQGGQIIALHRRANGDAIDITDEHANAATGHAIYYATSNRTGDNMFALRHDTSTFNGNGLDFDFQSGSGSFTGNYINANKNLQLMFRVDNKGDVYGAGVLQSKAISVTALPTCNGGLEGAWASVFDSNTSIRLLTVGSGGSNHMPVYCDGTNWVVH